jgi:GNAT superfamily N-acetyltransferase
MSTTTEVVQLPQAQIKEASEVHARAFRDDPFWSWVLPYEPKRARVLPWLGAVRARYCHKHGEVHTTAGKVQGVALWIPPGKYPISYMRAMLLGWILAPLKLGPAGFGRVMRAANYMEPLHKRDVAPRHWYLFSLGVDPPRQGQGLGGALIQPVLARADAEGLPCYLESLNLRNLPFYGRRGFEIVAEDDIPNGGPHFWTMKREPAG